MDLLRSLLFVPGNRKDMLEKAVTRASSDALVADMEDSVPDAEKSAARETIAEMLPSLVSNGHKIVVRVNALDTGRNADEVLRTLEALKAGGLTGCSWTPGEDFVA